MCSVRVVFSKRGVKIRPESVFRAHDPLGIGRLLALPGNACTALDSVRQDRSIMALRIEGEASLERRADMHLDEPSVPTWVRRRSLRVYRTVGGETRAVDPGAGLVLAREAEGVRWVTGVGPADPPAGAPDPVVEAQERRGRFSAKYALRILRDRSLQRGGRCPGTTGSFAPPERVTGAGSDRGSGGSSRRIFVALVVPRDDHDILRGADCP